MLKSLQVKDYALIEHIDVEFGYGLNIITGETGAGKSILIDAMSLLLGERASTETVRKDSSKAVIEGIFDVEANVKVKQILEENEIEFLPELIIRREISVKGSNRCFINDSPVPLQLIKDIGNLLVDLHGQHEHQSLLRTETHIEFLDEYGNYDGLLKDYSESYRRLLKLIAELASLKEKESILKEKKDIYAFQIKEIDNISPMEDEEEKLNQELNILENSEKILELTSEVYEFIYDSQNSVYDQLGKMQNKLIELNKIDSSFNDALAEFTSTVSMINNISMFIRDYKLKVDLDPQHLNEIRERLGALTLLKKKYGGSLKAVLAHREKIRKEFELAENYTGNISELELKLNELRVKCGSIAESISNKRKEAVDKIQKEVKESLSSLGIPDSEFAVRINQTCLLPKGQADRQVLADEVNGNFIIVNGNKFKAFRSGYDEVEFFISTNRGEDLKPLAKVASGGEVSRIMLALKSILAKNDKLPLLIFDEIDTGVSGRIAQKVGQTLKSLAEFHQIISITHLPQIAGLADHHYSVEKKLSEDRVVSSIKKLKDNERIKEVAKLMSGEKITEASLNGARELMGLQNK